MKEKHLNTLCNIGTTHNTLYNSSLKVHGHRMIHLVAIVIENWCA
jgi:hypothetical protein